MCAGRVLIVRAELSPRCLLVRTHVVSYTEDGKPPAGDPSMLPLPEGALTNNLGLPLIFLCLKVRTSLSLP